jgi:membrane-associated protein
MPRLGILVATLLGAGALAAALVVDLQDVAVALRRLAAALGPWTYALVGALVVVETTAILGAVSPGEAVLAVGGAAAAHGTVELPALIAVASIAGVLGDASGYALGRRYGRGILVRCGPGIGLSADRLARLDRAIGRWGGMALVGGRFVGLLRSLTPFLAGASARSLRSLAAFSVAGAIAWSSALIITGHTFAAAMESHLDAACNIALGLVGAAVLMWALRTRRRAVDLRCDAGAETRSLRPFARCSRK